MTFQDNPTLGKFNGDVAAISRSIDDRCEEIKAAYERIAELEITLEECREYLEDHVDVVDGSEGPAPNRAMQLVTQIDETLHGESLLRKVHCRSDASAGVS